MRLTKDLIWPGLMFLGSCLSATGSMVAISVGADKVNGRINPFFYMALGNSLLYATSNGIKIFQIATAPEVEEVQERDLEIGISRPSSPELPTLDERTLEMVRSSYREKELARQNSEIRR